MSQNGNLPQISGENKKYLKPPLSDYIFSIGNPNLNLHPSDCEPGSPGGATGPSMKTPRVDPAVFLGRKNGGNLAPLNEPINLQLYTACELGFFLPTSPQFPKKQHVFLGKGWIPFNQQILWRATSRLEFGHRHNFTPDRIWG